jgi:hypothetical protein
MSVSGCCVFVAARLFTGYAWQPLRHLTDRCAEGGAAAGFGGIVGLFGFSAFMDGIPGITPLFCGFPNVTGWAFDCGSCTFLTFAFSVH